MQQLLHRSHTTACNKSTHPSTATWKYHLMLNGHPGTSHTQFIGLTSNLFDDERLRIQIPDLPQAALDCLEARPKHGGRSDQIKKSKLCPSKTCDTQIKSNQLILSHLASFDIRIPIIDHPFISIIWSMIWTLVANSQMVNHVNHVCNKGEASHMSLLGG